MKLVKKNGQPLSHREIMINNNWWTIFHAVITLIAHLATFSAVLWNIWEVYGLKHGH
jgi:hypothetical protein